MPPKKKSGFMIFTLEWKSKYGKRMNISEATEQAGKVWQNMTMQERGPYLDRAKNDNIAAKNSTGKLTCTGVPLSVIEQRKQEQDQIIRSMKKCIEETVQDSLKRNELEKQKYYVVMVNYFTKTLQGGVYVPAEISICEYTIKDGISNKFHSLINPGVNIYGHSYEAQDHAEKTHVLPLPPNALGEADLGKLYNSILHFIRPNDDGEYPPLYTPNECMPIVESVISFLRSDPGSNNVDLKIYSINYLFFNLKMTTTEVGEIRKPDSIYETDLIFQSSDKYEYMPEIACDFHQKIDKSNYCTLSCTMRWCFSMSENLCDDLAIKYIMGRHVPFTFKKETTQKCEASSDTESFVSVGSESTCATKALSEHKVYYDDQKSNVSSRRPMFQKDDFPNLAGSSRKKQSKQPTEVSHYFDKDDESEVNHWAGRSRKVPPQPDESHFKIDVSEMNKMTDLNDTDDVSSVVSIGRGRLLKPGFGRGSSLYK